MWNPNQQKPNAPGHNEMSPLRGASLWLILMAGMFALLLYSNNTSQKPSPLVGYSLFRRMVLAGQVDKAVVYDTRIACTKKKDPPKLDDAELAKVPEKFITVRPTGTVEGPLMEFLTEHKVTVEARQPSQLVAMLSGAAVLIFAFLVVAFVMRRANPAERAMAFGRSKVRQYVEKDTKVTFDDVAGIEEPKAELQEIVEYLRSPDKFRRLGGRIPRGVLLVGAPGTGKTLLAKAVAGEAKVPFFSMSGSDFVEMFVGVGASRVRDLFRQAEQQSPCIIFIDELDALGKARGASLLGGGHDEREQTLNQLLVEMDGFDSTFNIILMAATNRPEILDPALMRPGRFDRQVMIPPPDINGREEILRVHARKVRLSATVDLRRVAARTPGFVGADLANVVNEAALLAARRDREGVEFEDFDEAIDRVSIGLERKSHVMSEEEKRVTAYHEAGHAITATFSEHADPVHKVSIIPRGLAEGVTIYARQNDRHNYTKAQLEAMLVTAIGGRTAEELVFDQISTGASSDIRKITNIAEAMVTEFGMSTELGPINYDTGYRADAYGMAAPSQGRPLSETTAQRVDAAIRALVDSAHERARALLEEHRDALEQLAERLLEAETVDRDELYAMLGLPVPEEPHTPSRGQVQEAQAAAAANDSPEPEPAL